MSTDFLFEQTAIYYLLFKTTSKANLEMMFLVVMFFGMERIFNTPKPID